MKPFRHILLLCILSLSGWALADLEKKWQKDILPMMEYYCFDCHGDGMDKGGVNLDDFKTIADMKADRPLWENIEKHLKLSLMPPLDEEQLKAEEKDALMDWIDRAVFPTDPENRDPGPTLIRRLNRVEYENTINDLLGVKVSVKDILPADDSGYGFDNISKVLTLSPTHLDKLFQTAEIALKEAFSTKHNPETAELQFTEQRGGAGRDNNQIYVYGKDAIILGKHHFSAPGDYEIQISAGGIKDAENVPPLMELSMNQKHLKQFFITNAYFHEEYKTYTHRVSIPTTGTHEIGVALINRPDTSFQENKAGQLRLFKAEIVGPLLDKSALPAFYKRLIGDAGSFPTQEAYFRAQIGEFLFRAFRRPPSDEEKKNYVSLALSLTKKGVSQTEALRSSYLAALLSPDFLFREGHKKTDERTEAIISVDEFTLASRLSYFLWSSMPDKELLKYAKNGTLRKNLDLQITRMLKSPNTSAFIENYIGQWLQLRDVPLLSPSRKHFKGFDHKLQSFMKKETELLVSELLKENKSLMTLLTSEHTYLNEPLAKHYGITGVTGKGFSRVKIKDTARHGLLGHGSFLMLTSHPDRTSPVLRGKYVLENLLDLTPPPPPQDANQITEAKILKHHSLRQQLELHRQDPSCASCHNLMDPIGFGLETFNAIGQQRKSYPNGKPVLTYGSLYRGEIFHDASSLREELTEKYAEDFYTAAIKNLLIYATGRGMRWYDRGTVNELLSNAKENDGRLKDLIKDVIYSVPFQSRRTVVD